MQDSVFTRALTSLKVWTIIIGGIVTAGGSMLAKWGLNVSDATVQQIAGSMVLLVGLLVHAQGRADQGKNAVLAATPAATADPAPPTEVAK